MSASERYIPVFATDLSVLAGAERSLLALTRFFHRQGIPFRLVTYANTCDFQQYADFPLPLVEIAPTGGFRTRVKALRRYFEGSRTDVLPLFSGYQAALHASIAGLAPFHCLMHDTPILFTDDGWKSRVRTAISNRVIAHAFRSGKGKMIVTSEFLQQDCRKLFGVDAEIARMGGLESAAGIKARAVEGPLRMLSVCRLEQNKRVDWILEALATMEAEAVPLSQRVDWRLDIAGKGALMQELKDKAAALGIAERVHFLGFVPDAELEALFDAAHLFLMPAVQGYGIPAIEALQRGIPVLLHRDSGVSDILLDTPWATVLTGGPEDMQRKLPVMVERLIANEQMQIPLPQSLPTEESWARRVSEICGYIL